MNDSKPKKYGKLNVVAKTGTEPFHKTGNLLGFSLSDFWSWSSSDLVGNALRGLVAEFLVAKAVGAEEPCRVEWDAYDVKTPDGLKIEVKSAAYVQSWDQNKPSSISFSIAPAKGWDARTNTYAENKVRIADVYVFCLLAHTDQETIDPMDVGQWRFFVLPTTSLDVKVSDQKTITLEPLLALGAKECDYAQLKTTINNISQN